MSAKEILEYLGNDKNYKCDCNDGSYYLELSYREAHELKDCITNLQEENERSKCVDVSNKCLRSANDTLDKKCHSFHILYEDYKSRNEKAIEYIKTTSNIDGYINHNAMMYRLLNILTGGDDKDVKN